MNLSRSFSKRNRVLSKIHIYTKKGDASASPERSIGKNMDTTGLLFPKQKTKKKRKRHPPSIICRDKKSCYLCGRYGYTEEHHIFEGPNRELSEEYGLKVYLCLYCHREGKQAAHKNADTADYLHRIGQQAFEERCGSRERFRELFGRNYL